MIAIVIKVLAVAKSLSYPPARVVLQSQQDGRKEVFPSLFLPPKSVTVLKPWKSRYAQVGRSVNRSD